MKKYTVLAILVFILFSGCQSLPEPKEDHGLLIFQVKAENNSQLDYLTWYKLKLNSGDDLISLYPHTGFTMRMLPSGSYTVNTIESIPNVRNVTTGTPQNVTIQFEILPKQITYFQFRLDVKQGPDPRRENYTIQNQNWRPLARSDIYNLSKQIEKYEGVDLWINQY